MLRIFALTAFLLSSASASDFTSKLKNQNKLQIPENQCRSIESKLGQLFYVTIYLNSRQKPFANHRSLQLIQDLNLGGVLTHYVNLEVGDRTPLDPLGVYEWNKKIHTVSRTPIFIGVDYLGYCGLGAGQGILNASSEYSCKNEIFDLEAKCQAAYGVNQVLGPTVEYNQENQYSQNLKLLTNDANSLIQSLKKMGIASTLKHYPYTPDESNLHRESKDTMLGVREVERRLENFSQAVRTGAEFVMSTHLFDSKVDPKYIATFSKIWIAYLRNALHFNGILMTDALFMLSNYGFDMLTQMSKSQEFSQFHREFIRSGIFAAKAILAGHDMVLLDSEGDDARGVFEDLLFISCQDTKISSELRGHIEHSYQKIIDYKKANTKRLTQNLPFKGEFIAAANSAITEKFLYGDNDHSIDCHEVKSALNLFDQK